MRLLCPCDLHTVSLLLRHRWHMEIGIGVSVNGKKNLFEIHKTSESESSSVINSADEKRQYPTTLSSVEDHIPPPCMA